MHFTLCTDKLALRVGRNVEVLLRPRFCRWFHGRKCSQMSVVNRCFTALLVGLSAVLWVNFKPLAEVFILNDGLGIWKL